MARSHLKCERTNDFGYGEIGVNRIPFTSRELPDGRSWSLTGTSEHSYMLKHICQWKVQQSCDLHFTNWMYYLCYVIGRSASTRSKKSSIIRLVYKPFVLSPHLSPTTPLAHTHLYFFGQRCFLYHLIATVSSAILVQASPEAPWSSPKGMSGKILDFGPQIP